MLKTQHSPDKIIAISFVVMISTLIIVAGTVMVLIVLQNSLKKCPVSQSSPQLRNIHQHNGYWVISNFVQNEKWETNKCDTDVTYAVQGDYVDIYKLEELYSNGFSEYTSFAVFIPNSEYMIQSRKAIAYVRHRLYYNTEGLKVPNTSIRKYVSFHLYFSYDEKLPFDSLPNNGFEDVIALSKRNSSCSDVKKNLYTANCKLFTNLGNLTQDRNNSVTVGKNIAQLQAHTNYILNGDINYYPSFHMSKMRQDDILYSRSQFRGRNIENLLLSQISQTKFHFSFSIWYIPVLLTNLQRPNNPMARANKFQLIKFIGETGYNTFVHKKIIGGSFNVTSWLGNSDNNYKISDFTQNFKKFLEYKTFYIVDTDFPLLDESAELTVDQSENLRIFALQLLKYKCAESNYIYLIHPIDADDEILHNQFDSIDKKIRLEYKYAYDGRLELYGEI